MKTLNTTLFHTVYNCPVTSITTTPIKRINISIYTFFLVEKINTTNIEQLMSNK
mgnify:CR=1 FL=1